jgi:hypothetical protein
VLAPDWLANTPEGVSTQDPSFAYALLAGLYVDPGTVNSAEATLQAVFLFEFALRAWAERFRYQYITSPVALVDFAAILPSLDVVVFGGLGSSAAAALRPLRLFRVLRLLRLLDFGIGNGPSSSGRRASGVSEKVASVAVEFMCVFLISGELFYDLEYEVNPAISDVGDCLYWSFLTLTGIGQPFEAVTAQGRVATVASILTALVVVPLQLAKIVGNQTPSVADDASVAMRASWGETAAFPIDAPTPSRFRSFGEAAVPRSNLLPESNFADGSASQTFDSVDEAYALTVYGERTENLAVGEEELAPRGGVSRGAAYEGLVRELRGARHRLRTFEIEVDALREENATLRRVLTRRRVKNE